MTSGDGTRPWSKDDWSDAPIRIDRHLGSLEGQLSRGGAFMSMQGWLERHPRLTLVGDACLVSAASFGLASGIGFLVAGHQEPPAWIAVPLSVLTLGTVILGPALAWLLRGRGPTWWGVLGAFLATVLVILGSQVLALLATGLAWLLAPITTEEFAGPIALLLLASIWFGAICSIPVLGIAAAVGTSQRGRMANRLLAMRAAALASMAAFIAGAVSVVETSTDPERAEVYVFAMLGGFTGAAMAFGADVARTLRRPRADPACGRR